MDIITTVSKLRLMYEHIEELLESVYTIRGDSGKCKIIHIEKEGKIRELVGDCRHHYKSTIEGVVIARDRKQNVYIIVIKEDEQMTTIIQRGYVSIYINPDNKLIIAVYEDENEVDRYVIINADIMKKLYIDGEYNAKISLQMTDKQVILEVFRWKGKEEMIISHIDINTLQDTKVAEGYDEAIEFARRTKYERIGFTEMITYSSDNKVHEKTPEDGCYEIDIRT